ncbi:Threonyl/alanyl tRNA synthetase [Microdochium trichocladiopsis]|uniref:Threonyl/alanyl tRNA synthetase n=1 Tax=Microdochium trichocladiopsis TaxID=1682393 RepID=A0A9P8Y2R0_9PEZI|nr:Threonyl/alanyl tRNA synthetase [Microdochium trichocladiopsis]KAH7027389.1 Threonyl/alanyl tRNA synthetase [Microdochium trichocladiopsis]
MAAVQRTIQVFQRNAKLHSLTTAVLAVRPFASLQDADKALYKAAQEGDEVVVTEETIFHPQGGGQPSDEGTIKSEDGSSQFDVKLVRMSATAEGEVLHFGRFGGAGAHFKAGDSVTQTIDSEKRLLYSRYHTAGHVLGSAVRHCAQDSVPGFDELNADHAPGMAACNFAGVLEGKWKETFQAKLDEYIEKDMPVEIEWWDEGDFKSHGLERLIPDRKALGMTDTEKFRIVTIVGAESYPCGGTHVESTKLCGKTTVRKIGRSKGTSRVSYALA